MNYKLIKQDKLNFKNCNIVKLINNVSGKEGRKSTLFCASYNDDGISFKFVCEDEDIFADMTNFNDKLFDQDVVEVFLCETRDLHNYTELEISPLGTVLELKIHNDLNGKFEGTLLTEDIIERKIFKDDKGYEVEFFVPFKLLAKKATKGDKWLFNAYRIDRNNASVIDRKQDDFDYYSINPTFKPEYHHPKFFSELIFN